jgi:rhamnosyltransferase
MSESKAIGAVAILFRPNWETTTKALKKLSEQVDLVVVVDNTPDIENSEYVKDIPNCKLIPLKENIGIAAAQNKGIAYIQEAGYEFVVFSDQDSIAPDGLIDNLVSTYRLLENEGLPVATIGPLPIQRQTGQPVLDPQNIREKRRIKNIEIMRMDGIISSFSLMRLDTLKKVGGMKENLFIDGVDVEWCWRAKSLYGLNSFLIPSLTISHMLGEGSSKTSIRIPTPFRTYYQFRNYFILKRLSYTPSWWKKKNGLKYFVKAFYYPLMLKPRGQYLKNIWKGLVDGIKFKDT